RASVAVTRAGALRYTVSRGGGGRAVLSESVVDGSTHAIRPQHRGPATPNFLAGAARAAWRRAGPPWGALALGSGGPGVAVELRAARKGVEKLFHVQPGTDVANLRLAFDGVADLRVTEDGALAGDTALGEVRFTAPVAFQQGAAGREPVHVTYVIDAAGYGFAVGAYDVTRELVIDPILDATYLGGADYDSIFDRKVAPDGTVIGVGYSQSPEFPGITPGGFHGTIDGVQDGFVARFDPSLGTLLAGMFVGGAGTKDLRAVALDAAGTVYVAGRTSASDVPRIDAQSAGPTPDCDRRPPQCDVGYVLRLPPALDDVWAATYIDGDDVEVGSLALGPDESVYVAGDTRYAVLTGIGPTSARANPGCEDYDGCEGFVVRFDAALSTVLGGTYVGGSLADSVRGLAIGPGGDVWVVGDTRSPDFAGVGANAVDSDVSPAGWDGFVARLDASLHAFEAATYLGGSGETFPSAVAFDG